MESSKRISLATKWIVHQASQLRNLFSLPETVSFKLYLETSIALISCPNLQAKGASDEYNIINYGIGGQIEVHVDYWNEDNKREGEGHLFLLPFFG